MPTQRLGNGRSQTADPKTGIDDQYWIVITVTATYHDSRVRRLVMLIINC